MKVILDAESIKSQKEFREKMEKMGFDDRHKPLVIRSHDNEEVLTIVSEKFSTFYSIIKDLEKRVKILERELDQLNNIKSLMESNKKALD